MKRSIVIFFVLVSNLAYSQDLIDRTMVEAQKIIYKLEEDPDIRNYSEMIAHDSLNPESYFKRARGYYTIWLSGDKKDSVSFELFKKDLYRANMLDSTNCCYNQWIANKCMLPDSLAIRYYNKSISVCGMTERDFLERSFCLMRLKRYEDAIKDINMAKRLTQGTTDEVARAFKTNDYIKYRGLCYAKLGKFKEAEKDLRKVIKEDGTNWQNYIYLGIVKSMQGKYEEALKIYDDLRARAPFVISNYMYIGNVYHAMGNELLAEKNWYFAEKNGVTVDEKNKAIDTQIDYLMHNFRLGAD
ncbi:MAG TPA: tetratricopeptide repeat protein [Bacteroidales bacterium]|nr:tetratricopeptide repeat protein [Bacteroidales bacterium]